MVIFNSYVSLPEGNHPMCDAGAIKNLNHIVGASKAKHDFLVSALLNKGCEWNMTLQKSLRKKEFEARLEYLNHLVM